MEDLITAQSLEQATGRSERSRSWKILTRCLPYAAVALATIIALYVAYGLRRANLKYPIQFLGADGTLALYIVKALGENSLLHNHRVGAPFGLDYNDVYQADFIQHWALRVLMRLTGNALLTMNIYYLAGFVLIAWSAFYVLRRYRVSSTCALICAVLYAFTPSHLYRAFYHLFLSEYFLLPLVVLLALRIMSDHATRSSSHYEPRSAADPVDSAGRKTGAVRLLYFGIPLAVLVGGTGVYYAFYSALLLGLAAVYAAFRRGRLGYSATGLICAATISLTTIAGMWPIFQYRQQHGKNEQVAQRSVGETEVYSLKLADLYLPAPQHPIKQLRDLSRKYNESLPLLNVNESEFSALGILGAIGFTALLLCSFTNASGAFTNASGANGLMKCLAALNLGALLYAMTEGFGALFSFLITPEIRCNNRLIFFIDFFALFAFALIVDRLARRLPNKPSLRIPYRVALLALLIFGLYDRGITQVRQALTPLRTSYENDDRFVKAIEAQMPGDAAVLQLPFQSFPEIEGPYHLGSYDLLRAYVHSRTLRWSYPAMRGRPGETWIQNLISLPVPALVPHAVAGGFSGIYIDRDGYADAGASIESQLAAVIGSLPIVSANGELSFFSLQKYAATIKQRTPDADWRKLIFEDKLILTFPSGVYQTEMQGSHQWRWAEQHGELQIDNETGTPQQVELAGELFTGFSATSHVYFRTEKESFEASATAAGNQFDWRLLVHPGSNRIFFNTDAARVPAPADSRVLYIRMENFRLLAR